MRRGIATCLVLVPLAIGLAGCGYNRGDRAVSGGCGWRCRDRGVNWR
jgi:hypothetical protein